MKKKLLYFILLLVTNLFYAQVNPIEHCYDDTYFDLTVNNSLLLGNLNPAETTLTYHVSLQEANMNVNPILQVTQFKSTEPSRTIYARIDNKGTVTTNYFNLILNPRLNTVGVTAQSRCYGANDGFILMQSTGGKAPYVYRSVNNGANNGPYQTSPYFYNLVSGVYTIEARDQIGCISTTFLVITEPNPLTADVLVDANNIRITAAGGTGSYEYAVSTIDNVLVVPYQASNLFSDLATGTYTIYVKDTNGCIVSKTNVNVAPRNTLSAIASVTAITCNNPTATIAVEATGGSATYRYSINNGPSTTSNLFTDLTAGTYTIIVTDSQGATTSLTKVISAVNPPEATLVVGNVSCFGVQNGYIKVEKVKPSDYSYSLNGGPYRDGNSDNNSYFNNLGPGNYTINVRDNATGCIKALTAEITQPNQLTADAMVDANNIRITAAGGTPTYEYALSGINNLWIPYQSGDLFPNLAEGTYTAYAKDANGCIVSKTGINVAPRNTLSAVATTTLVTCSNPTATITVTATGGTGSYKYLLNNEPLTTSNVFPGLAPGTYYITVRDIQDATVTLIVEVKKAVTPKAVLEIVTNVTCFGEQNGAIKVQTAGDGGYTYSVNGGVNIIGTGNNPILLKNLAAGTYNITVKDNITGCVSSVAAIITQPSLLTATVEANPQILTITTSGGSGQYVFSLDGSAFQSSPYFTNISYGYHSVHIKDSNGCYFIKDIAVNPPAPLVNGKNAIVFEFKAGQTLADIVVEGQNITWYSNKSSSTGKKAETSLPLTTVLVNGIIYYASQTINGIESTERLAVTAKSDGALSTPDFELGYFKFSPNPVKHILTLDNKESIDEIEIFSTSGASVLFKKINTTHSEIDLSSLSTGIYILKVKANGKVKAIKFVKE
ncbi:T9SS type A sorting domain-containing protein [Flavobacterium sp. Fl-318]|uniref:T9SS type A sorting domain-containing protein n=1 Tax=Flavobacterium cupriresistens TaxID=2893885 RepID=A0ABU4RKY9_9FLAO|nr:MULTISPECIES: T9SS type A sorting domain-containing protein [unclassified Flavobacterium]MDX6192030.1 T9SS type A sorting domain-containing protein [Flavobacterium sp. Fl-318]UFH43783.1 T9SS type A sorting domain-containing protein [Flavobacterium sp. F-323]